MKNKTIWFVVLSVGITSGFFVWMSASLDKKEVKLENLTSREVALTCTTDMATEYHIHPELVILIKGQEVFVPKNLGIKPTCMTSIHTHQENNILHVEAPVQKDFTLGDFFAVWDNDFSRSRLLDNIVDDTSEITVTVNGTHVDTFENTILKDTEKIVIEYKQK